MKAIEQYVQFRTLLHALYLKKVIFVILHHCMLRALHWLPVAYRIVFKILLLTFRAIHKLAPTYISELVSLKETGGRYYFRSNDGKLINIPSCKSLSTSSIPFCDTSLS